MFSAAKKFSIGALSWESPTGPINGRIALSAKRCLKRARLQVEPLPLWWISCPSPASLGQMPCSSLALDGTPLGALEIHRDTCDMLTPDEIVDVVHLADGALTLLLGVEQ